MCITLHVKLSGVSATARHPSHSHPRVPETLTLLLRVEIPASVHQVSGEYLCWMTACSRSIRYNEERRKTVIGISQIQALVMSQLKYL